MALDNKRTTQVLLGLALCFIVIIIIICAIPSQQTPTYVEQGRNRQEVPDVLITTSTTPATTSTSTTPATSSTSTTPATSTSTTPTITSTSTTPATTSTSTTHVTTSTSTTPATTSTDISAKNATSSSTTTPATTSVDTSTTNTTMSTNSSTTHATTSDTETTSSSTSQPLSTTAPPPTDKETKEMEERVCHTKECEGIAAMMLSMKDYTGADPCENFYQYACGRVLDNEFLDPVDPERITNKFILEKLLRVNEDDPDLGEMKKYFESCRKHDFTDDTELRESFTNIFKMTGYSFVTNDAARDSLDLPVVLGKMMKYGFTPFFDLRVDVDDEDPTKFKLKLTPPLNQNLLSRHVPNEVCLSLQHKDLEDAWVKDEEYNITDAYHKYKECLKGVGSLKMFDRTEDAVKRFGLINIPDDTERDIFISAISNQTRDFYQRVIEILPDVPTRRATLLKQNHDEYAKPKTLWRTMNLFEGGFWDPLWEQLNIDREGSTNVYIYFQSELQQIFELLQHEMSDPQRLRNILHFLWAEYLYTNLVKSLGSEVGSDDYCYRATVNLLPDYTSNLYLTSLSDMDNRISQIGNMTDASKRAAMWMMDRRNNPKHLLEKLKKMEGTVVGKDVLKGGLKDEGVSTITTNDFLGNTMTLLGRKRILMYNILKEEADPRNTVFLHPYSTMGVASYALNKFFIPLGAMESPLYHPHVPKYLKYADLGHMVALELMHGFDRTGLSYDGETRYEENMLEHPIHLDNSSRCLSEEMSQSQTLRTHTNITMRFKVNHDLKLNEHLANSGAIRLAWEAYLQELSPSTPEEHSITGTEPPMVAERRRRSARLSRMKRSDTIATNPFNTHLPKMNTSEPKLPYLNLEPIQLYFLYFAQTQCGASSELDMLSVMEGEYLPAHLRVNLILQNEPLFANAFNCTAGDGMKKEKPCPYLLG